jgi:CheY-like chemotaxis protein
VVCLPVAGSDEFARAPKLPEGRGTSRRVVVVDDYRELADSIRMLFEVYGVEVRVAYDGASALALCERWWPTHVLIDLSMAGMDGFELARRLRGCFQARPVRLIAMSGWAHAGGVPRQGAGRGVRPLPNLGRQSGCVQADAPMFAGRYR